MTYKKEGPIYIKNDQQHCRRLLKATQPSRILAPVTYLYETHLYEVLWAVLKLTKILRVQTVDVCPVSAALYICNYAASN